jgi:hypothetical protein
MTDPSNDTIMATASAPSPSAPTKFVPINLATISSGFEKGDFLVREEKGQRVYFDFFEEAFNYVSLRICGIIVLFQLVNYIGSKPIVDRLKRDSST